MMVNLRREKFYWLGTHEMLVQKAVSRSVRPGMVVYDIGAHTGFFSLVFARLVGKAGLVCAFEPFPENRNALLENVRLNRLENVRVISSAVSCASGKTGFCPNDRFSSMGKMASEGGGSEGTIDVDMVSIDDFVFRSGNRAPDFLKMDVEGTGGDIIRGMCAVAAEKRPHILMEVHNLSEQERLRELVSRLSYTSTILEQSEGAPRFPYHVLALPGTRKTQR